MLNGAGFHHSDQHGFGLMDAWWLSLAAARWPLLPPMTNHSTRRQISRVIIPSDGTALLKVVYGKGVLYSMPRLGDFKEVVYGKGVLYSMPRLGDFKEVVYGKGVLYSMPRLGDFKETVLIVIGKILVLNFYPQ